MFGGRKISKPVFAAKHNGVKMLLENGSTAVFLTGNCQHQGARLNQEDSFGFSSIANRGKDDQSGLMAVLADGMGGLSNGKAVSEHVVSFFLRRYSQLDYEKPVGEQLAGFAREINDDVCGQYAVDGKSGAGSTLVAALIHNAKLYWVCAGDSRLYLLRNRVLYHVNEEHIYSNQLLSDYIDGLIDIEDIEREAQKNSLTSYIGSPELKFVDYSRMGFPLLRRDTLVLCSDGIYNSVSDSVIAQTVFKHKPQAACERITEAVLAQRVPGQDNMSIIAIHYK